MIQGHSDSAKYGILAVRRLTLLASVGAIGAALLLAGPRGNWPTKFTAGATAAEFTLQHRAGFADIVAKLKPAVISVRVKRP